MLRKMNLLLVCLMVVLLLSACGPSQADLDATATQVAADIFATQTAAAPTPTPTLTSTPTVTPTPTATPTPTPTPEPPTVRLAPDGSGDYPSLEAAVEAVPPGSTLMLEPGTYRLEEPLDVSKPLQLVGAGMDQTEIVSEAEGYVVRFSGDGSFAAEDITFRHQGRAAADVVVVQGGEIAFARCRFIGATREEKEYKVGLWLGGSTTGVVRDCAAVENGVGMLIVGQAQPTLEGNVCTENGIGIIYADNASGVARQNECSGNGLHGIYVSEQAQPTLERNICTDNADTGISYLGDAGGVARQNECLGNGLHGIGIEEQAQPRLEGNVCTDNEQAGIAYAGNAGGVARQNECSGNGLHGIAVVEQAQPTLKGNICTDNEAFGIYVAEQAQPTLEGNVCTKNDIGIEYMDNSGGVAYQNQCSGNTAGIAVAGQAQPTLEGNVCTENQIGIAYAGNASGVARQNKCSRNQVGIGLAETANPDLVDNDCHDNTVEDIRDVRRIEPAIVFAYCSLFGESPVYVQKNQPVTIKWRWIAATSDYVQDYIDAAEIEVLLDGQEIRLEQGEIEYDKDKGDYRVIWSANVGTLSPGSHRIESRVLLTRQISDGWDTFSPGELQYYCDIIVQ